MKEAPTSDPKNEKSPGQCKTGALYCATQNQARANTVGNIS